MITTPRPTRQVVPDPTRELVRRHALSQAYEALGFVQATKGDEVFWQLVLARIIEPTSKEDSVRVLGETGVAAVS